MQPAAATAMQATDVQLKTSGSFPPFVATEAF